MPSVINELILIGKISSSALQFCYFFKSHFAMKELQWALEFSFPFVNANLKTLITFSSLFLTH